MEDNALLTPILSYFPSLKKKYSMQRRKFTKTFQQQKYILPFGTSVLASLKLDWQAPRLFGQSPFHSSKDLEH